MTDWRPIETAPKDGSQIILSNGVDVAQGWWADVEGYIRERRDLDGRYIDQDEFDGFTGWMDCGGGMQPDPTHWTPQPEPPKPACQHAWQMKQYGATYHDLKCSICGEVKRETWD